MSFLEEIKDKPETLDDKDLCRHLLEKIDNLSS